MQELQAHDSWPQPNFYFVWLAYKSVVQYERKWPKCKQGLRETRDYMREHKIEGIEHYLMGGSELKCLPQVIGSGSPSSSLVPFGS